jgi:hypothetical protein
MQGGLHRSVANPNASNRDEHDQISGGRINYTAKHGFARNCDGYTILERRRLGKLPPQPGKLSPDGPLFRSVAFGVRPGLPVGNGAIQHPCVYPLA